MKNLTNILSYLWLLLLMAVTACSDLEEEVGPMHVEEEVELTIQTEVSGMKGSTRTAPTESIIAITAYAFDSNSQLIKEVKAILSDDNKQATSGNLRIKVPKRTGDIHFIAKNNAESPDVTISIGDNVSTLLNQTSTTLHYWGKTTFDGTNATLPVTLYRNMAKVTLTLNNDLQGHIAGFVNYNQTGTLVPGNFEVGTLNATNDVTSHSKGDLGAEHYLFEHANVKDSSPLFAICKIGNGDLYYKIAFANANKEYFHIIRNHAYTITINSVEESLGGTYDEALQAEPINDANVVVQDVTMDIQPVSLTSYKGNTCQVTVTVPEGVTALSVTPDDDAFSVTSATLNNAAISPNNDVYIVTGGSTAKFSLTLNDNFIGTTGDHTISFEGSGTLVNATGTATITLNGFVDMYEMYFDGGKLGGSNEYDKFFHTRQGTFDTGDASGLETTFYDDGANSHKSKHLLMNSNNNNSFSFTIDDTRYLTLLVARSGNAPNISITGTLKDGSRSWNTENSGGSVVSSKHNFGNDGDITTAGRLIRYELPAGTYTLQRGNNDYLLYYMRVTKDKPTMTDIVQPSAADYYLSWTGGEYGNYLKDKNTINGTKYYVDDDATIFTPKLTYQGLSEMPLTTTSVTVVTDTLYFQDNKNSSGTRILKATETKSYNGNNPTLQFNAGTYKNLCGTIENIAETKYKYVAFYDVIRLKEVSDIEVRNTIKVGLYDDWYSTEALDHYTEGQLIMTGFKMPTHTIPVPVNVGAGTVESIGFSVSGSEWVRKNSGLGIGIDSNNAHNYSFTTQDETNNGEGMMRTHPRPEWIYRIEWENVAAESMTVSITDNTSDAYFSHGKQIAKSVTILTSVEKNTSLDIDLDFYSSTENRDDNNYSNLALNSSHFFLKATISKEDAQRYKGHTIQLKGDFPSINGAYSGWAMQWTESRQDNSTISYTGPNYNGQGLQFMIDENNPQTTYLIEWVFKHSANTNNYPGYGDIAFTYTISNYAISNVDGTFNNFAGDTSATIGFTNEPVGTELWSGSKSLSWPANGAQAEYITINQNLPAGTQVMLHFTTSGGQLEVHDSNTQSFRPNGIASDRYTAGNDDCFNVNNGETFIKFTLQNAMNGLKINGNAVTMTKIVAVYPNGTPTEELVFEYKFDNGNMENLSVVFHQDKGSQGTFDPTGGSLALNISSPGTDNWHAQITRAVSFEQNVTYKLTCKVHSDVSGNMVIWFDDPDNSHAVRVDNPPTVGLTDSDNFVNVEVNITPNQTDQAGRFVINFGLIPQGTIYIDDLKLVKKNN